jgi:hypothetical protein
MRTTTSIKPLTQRPAWKALADHYKKIQKLHLRKLFADDPKRGKRMAVEVAALSLDYSKNRITYQTLKLLAQLAKESDLSGRIAAMFSGEKINLTENRAVLHVALGRHYDILLTNVFAQAEALAFGKTPEEERPMARRAGSCRTGCSRATVHPMSF